jgi:hypothetical protein
MWYYLNLFSIAHHSKSADLISMLLFVIHKNKKEEEEKRNRRKENKNTKIRN